MHSICVYKNAHTCMHKCKYIIFVLYMYICIFICDPLIQPLLGRSKSVSHKACLTPWGWLLWPCFFFVYLPKRSNDTLRLRVGSVSCQADIQGQHPFEKVGRKNPKYNEFLNNFWMEVYIWMNFGCQHAKIIQSSFFQQKNADSSYRKSAQCQLPTLALRWDFRSGDSPSATSRDQIWAASTS